LRVFNRALKQVVIDFVSKERDDGRSAMEIERHFRGGCNVGDLERASSKKNPSAIDGIEGHHREKTSRCPTKNCLT
jgi:hypothetical protein